MNLNEVIKFSNKGFEVTRVAGGWIYKHLSILGQHHPISTTFVPFNNEFQKPYTDLS